MKDNAKTTPTVTRTVPIRELLRDQRFQVRSGKPDRGTVARYAAVYRSGRAMPAIKAALVGTVLVVVDGYHRLEALEALGREDVEVEITKATEREAYWMAASANLAHGKQLKPREVRNVFRLYVRARQHRLPSGFPKSYRLMAQDLGGTVSHMTICRWVAKDHPELAREISRGQPQSEAGPPAAAEKPDDFATTALRALHAALTAYRGVADPALRGELIATAEGIVEGMRAAGGWTEWDPYRTA